MGGLRPVSIIGAVGASVAAASLTASLFATPASAQTYCRDASIDREVGLAAQGKLDSGRIATLWRNVDAKSRASDPGCNTRVTYCIGRRAALADVEQAYALVGRPTPDMRAAKTLLDQTVRNNGKPWQALTLLGDVDAAIGRQNGDRALFLEAAGHLQFALNEVLERDKDGNVIPLLCQDFGETRPATEDTVRIRKRAAEAVMLSSQFATPLTRAGECGGVLLATTRGISAEAVPVPITFDFKSDALNTDGRKAADGLIECLKNNKLKEITLSGHTDFVGSDGYNMDLAARRLASVNSYLKAGGYSGVVHLLPKGLREPFVFDDASQYNQAQKDQMNRRVELREPRK